MKYVVLLGDGMADDPVPERDNKTPLELAKCPNLDRIADLGLLGLVETVPPDMEPGSDVANMSVLGYDPARYYSGRASIEAAALGIRLEPGQAAFRMNLVTLGQEDGGQIMADYSAGHPTAEEQKAVLETLTAKLGGEGRRFIPGVSFRNLCILDGFGGNPDLKPPHDYAGQKVSGLMPGGPGAEVIADLILKSQEALAGHAVNKERAKQGKAPINSAWFWGMGRAASMPSFHERHGKSAAVVTGVDLVRGLAELLDMEIVHVPGATGYVDTDYEGKADAVLGALDGCDFVFLHVEAPDEAGHEGELDLKVKAIEDFDQRAVSRVLAGLDKFGDYRVVALPDHETPWRQRCHRGGLVPFALASKADLEGGVSKGRSFSEAEAKKAGGEPVKAPLLLERLLFA